MMLQVLLTMNEQQENLTRAAFTLLQLIGVLAVMTVLAGVLLPFLIRSIDKIVSDKEIASLNSFESALQERMMRRGYIPSQADWGNEIAAQLGVQVSSVTTNARRQPRFFLIDPAFQVGTNFGGLPYLQNGSGSVVTNSSSGALIAPISPRLMIVTSLGPALTNMTSGVPSVTNDFNTIWNTPDNAVPGANSLSGWRGTADDLKVKRVNLSGMFVHLLLTTNDSPTGARYSVSGQNYTSAIPVPGTGQGKEAYFIKNSALLLYNAGGTLDSEQILVRNLSFVYDQGVWRGSPTGSGLVDGIDVASTVDQFLKAFPNSRATSPSTQQSNVVASMIDFFTAYDAWAANPGFPNGASAAGLKATAVSKQSAMMTYVQGLYMKNTHDPLPDQSGSGCP